MNYIDSMTTAGQVAVPSAEPIIQIEEPFPDILGATLTGTGAARTITLTAAGIVNKCYAGESTEDKALLEAAFDATTLASLMVRLIEDCTSLWQVEQG